MHTPAVLVVAVYTSAAFPGRMHPVLAAGAHIDESGICVMLMVL